MLAMVLAMMLIMVKLTVVLAMIKLILVKLNIAKSACYAHLDHLDQSLFTAV